MATNRTQRKTQTKTPGRVRQTAQRVKQSRVVRSASYVRKTTRRRHKQSRRIRRVLTRHNLGLLASLIGLVTTVLLTIFVGLGSVFTILTGVITAIIGVTTFVTGNSTPRDQIHVRRGDQTNRPPSKPSAPTSGMQMIRIRPRDRFAAIIRGGHSGDRARPLGGRKACGAQCQYSAKPVKECECSCNGTMHGVALRRRAAGIGNPLAAPAASPAPSKPTPKVTTTAKPRMPQGARTKTTARRVAGSTRKTP